MGLAVVGFAPAACGDAGGETGMTSPDDRDAAPGGGASAGRFAGGWRRVELGFVSAYLLARDGEAAVVDTGVDGSVGDIERVLSEAGLAWDAVAHVILTHKHPDHVGGLEPVLQAAADATAYAGREDVPAIASPRPLAAVADGDEVFGLQVVTTPGHTRGHVSVLDPEAGVLLAGDALVGQDGGVGGPNPAFTEDMDLALESVRRLSRLSFDTVLFGHGEPVEGGADAQVQALAERL